MSYFKSLFFAAIISSFMILSFSGSASAHCDTLDGPVVKDARLALEKKDITPILKWVRSADEQKIRDAFQKTLTVRTKGAEAKELSDRYFLETLVRIHRAGEGAPYTGLKPAGAVDPAVALADKALGTGSVDKLVDALTSGMAKGIRKRFQHTHQNLEHVDESVAAGREYVNAYVIFTHYVEGLHTVIKGKGGHHDTDKGGDTEKGGEHDH